MFETQNSRYVLCLLISLIAIQSRAQKSFDSLNVKLPKHYFNTLIGVDSYRKPERTFHDTSSAISRQLKSYGIRQLTVNFHTPLVTKVWLNADSSIANSHLLLTGTLMNLRPVFDGLKDHSLIKAGIGVRYIYNTGKKGVWFIDVSPFVTRDVSFDSKAYYRLASTVIYSHNVSEKFNWRLGVTKSFLWGNRLYLPFVGVRFGSLDKVNLSIQFPRSINLSLPLGSSTIFSLYSRAQGGMFNFANTDSIYKGKDQTFHFTRYEINTGLRFDFRIRSRFSFYLATGFSTRNNVTFYSDRANKRAKFNYNTYFYTRKMPNTLFFNLGFTIRLGKTKAYFKDRNLYDANDLNNVLGNNNKNGIPLPAKIHSKENLESIQDLVDYNDF